MSELTILKDLVVIFLVAVIVVTILRRVGLPTIAGFILAGTIAGPRGLALVHGGHEVELLAEIGVALLLFGIGLELQLARLRRLWKPVLLGGAVQMTTTAGAAMLIGRWQGLAWPHAIFVGLLLAISSTAIVLRGLEARGEIDAPHGRLTLGILVFQDLCVVPIVLIIPLLAAWAGGSGADSTSVAAGTRADTADLLFALGKALAVIVGILVAARLLVPPALHLIARTRQRELFVLTLFLICIGTAWIVALAGASLALGAFLAGLVVAGSVFRQQAMAELIPFREIFTSLFFISIGMLLDVGGAVREAHNVALLLAAILIGKFFFVLLTAMILRLPLRVCVLGATALAQVGEFAFVLMYAARGTTLIPAALAEPLLPAVILSMIVTPLALLVGPKLAAGAARMRPLTRLLGVRSAQDAQETTEDWADHVIIAGYGIMGIELAAALKAHDLRYVIVDLNPDNVRLATEAGEPAYYGDITSPEVLHALGVGRAKEIVVGINDPQATDQALAAVRQAAPAAHVLVRTRYAADAQHLCAGGASEVIPAEVEAAVAVTERVLARHGVSVEAVTEVTSGIRTRRHEYAGVCQIPPKQR